MSRAVLSEIEIFLVFVVFVLDIILAVLLSVNSLSFFSHHSTSVVSRQLVNFVLRLKTHVYLGGKQNPCFDLIALLCYSNKMVNLLSRSFFIRCRYFCHLKQYPFSWLLVSALFYFRFYNLQVVKEDTCDRLKEPTCEFF